MSDLLVLLEVLGLDSDGANPCIEVVVYIGSWHTIVAVGLVLSNDTQVFVVDEEGAWQVDNFRVIDRV